MKQPGKMGQHPSEMIPCGAKQGSQWTEITPQRTEMIPQRTEMVAQCSEMVKQHCGTISVIDLLNILPILINIDT